MPKRTNTFQQVVRLIYELMAEGAEVEESVLLEDQETGGEREIDVLITTSVAGIPFRIQIEATAQGETPDVKWVEAELGKRRAVHTDKLVLVSESGFTENARKKAEANGAIPIEPIDLTSEDQVGEIVNQLASIWPKTFALTPTHIAGRVELASGEEASATGLDLTTWIVTEEGQELGTISDEIRRRLDASFPDVAEQIGLAEIAGDVEAYFTLGMPDWTGQVDGKTFHACLRWQPDESKEPEFHRIVEILVKGKAVITVSEIELTHKKLGEFPVAYGEGRIGASDAVVVFTENAQGRKGAVQIGKQAPE